MTSEYEEFSRQLLSDVAKALGIDYESLVKDYRDRHYAIAAHWQAAVNNAVFAAYIDPRGPVERLVGYDPQKLLPSPEAWRLNLWSNKTLAEIISDTKFIADFFGTMAMDGECVIEFDRLYRDETILYVDPAGRVTDIKTRRVPIEGKLTPFVRPIDHIILDLDHRGGEIDGIIDMSSMLKKPTHTMSPKARKPAAPSYLDHDPTKRHGRTRNRHK